MNVHSATASSTFFVGFCTMPGMTKRLVLIFTLCLVSVVCSSGQNKFPYEEYDPRTLAELVEHGIANNPDYKDAKQVMIEGKPFYSAVRVKVTGTSRPLSDAKKNLFKMWQGALQMDPRVLDLLDKEYLFKECDREYWVAVQKQVAAYFPKELKEGDTITLYLMMVGGTKEKEGWEIVFLTNEYRKY